MGGTSTDELCKKFPKICECVHKERIDTDLKNNKSPYYVAKWLKETDCPISEGTIRRYQNYLKQHGEIKAPEPISDIDKECIDEKLSKKLIYAIDNVDFDNMNPNVQVQWILGLHKILYGDKHNVTMDANLKASILEKLERPIPILKKDDG